jgi:hypothetical protein
MTSVNWAMIGAVIGSLAAIVTLFSAVTLLAMKIFLHQYVNAQAMQQAACERACERRLVSCEATTRQQGQDLIQLERSLPDDYIKREDFLLFRDEVLLANLSIDRKLDRLFSALAGHKEPFDA